MWVGTFSGVTSAGIVISSARAGTWADAAVREPGRSVGVRGRGALSLTSSGNSSPTSDSINDVFPTWAARGSAVSAEAEVAPPLPAPARPRDPCPPRTQAPTLAQQQDAHVPLHGGAGS